MRTNDRIKLERIVKQASKVIDLQQESPEALYKSLMCNRIESVLADSSHPLHAEFQTNSRSHRFLQRRIRTHRYGSSFIPTAIKWYNEQLERWVVGSAPSSCTLYPHTIFYSIFLLK